MTLVSETQIVSLESQTALAASVILAVVCTMIEALLAHTFALTVGYDVAESMVQEGIDSLNVFSHEDVEGRQDKNRRFNQKYGQTTAYSILQSVQSHTDPLYEDSSHLHYQVPRLDTASFFQSLHSRK
jgi:hypothetical protein